MCYSRGHTRINILMTKACSSSLKHATVWNLCSCKNKKQKQTKCCQRFRVKRTHAIGSSSINTPLWLVGIWYRNRLAFKLPLTWYSGGSSECSWLSVAQHDRYVIIRLRILNAFRSFGDSRQAARHRRGVQQTFRANRVTHGYYRTTYAAIMALYCNQF